MDPNELTIGDYVDVLKRRKWSLILPFIIIVLTSSIVALVLSSIYKSTSTILIEEQDIPANFVMATVTSYADQRIQAINQRIMSSSRLLEIINRFNLYPDLRRKRTIDEIVGKMREDVKLEPISAEVVDRRSGRPTAAMIAFTLSYEGKDTPQKIQQVANMLASLFLQENLKVRRRQTKETSIFLEEEMSKLRLRLDEIEASLAVFKKQHINELPELLQVNQQSLHNLDREVDVLKEELRNLKERKGFLETQLASISPELEKEDEEDQKRLEQLKLQYANLKSRYSDAYPDVKKLKAEIKAIEDQVAVSQKASDAEETLPDNPAYISLSSQLTAIKVEIECARKKINEQYKKRNEYERRVQATPRVEEAYKTILIERNNTRIKHDDLMRKLMEAQVAQGLESEQKGERFTIIDPARLPEKPYKPNRLAIALIGFVLGLGAGIGMAAFKEYIDDSIRDADTLTQTTTLPVLAVIPEILTRKDITLRRLKRAAFVMGSFLIVIVGVSVFHFMVMDLNVFWARLMRKVAAL